MNPLRGLALDLLDLVAPRQCSSCLASYPTFPSPAMAVFCATCAVSLEPAEDPPPEVLVPYAHGGPLARAIHHAKYGQSVSVSRTLGTLLAEWLRTHAIRADCVVPVPLHPRRLATRGFNQAIEMSRPLRIPIAIDAVVRTRDTVTQVGLRRADRIVNVLGAFAPRTRTTLRGSSVLVVDDVVTTGATLAEVSIAVRAAGAAQVTCVALARAPLDGR